MADITWPQFVAATSFASTDELVGMVGLANARFTRDVLLAAVPGDQIAITSAGTNFLMKSTGNAEFDLAAAASFVVAEFITGFSCQLSGSSGWTLNLGSSGSFTVNTPTGGFLQIDIGSNLIYQAGAGTLIALIANNTYIELIDGGGILMGVDAGQVVFMPYLDGTGGAWIGSPADINTAMDRIALWVKANLGAIP